jgi:hypothetical protein
MTRLCFASSRKLNYCRGTIKGTQVKLQRAIMLAQALPFSLSNYILKRARALGVNSFQPLMP